MDTSSRRTGMMLAFILAQAEFIKEYKDLGAWGIIVWAIWWAANRVIPRMMDKMSEEQRAQREADDARHQNLREDFKETMTTQANQIREQNTALQQLTERGHTAINSLTGAVTALDRRIDELNSNMPECKAHHADGG